MATENKTAIVTGSTSGIGRETVKALAKADYHLVLPVRNMEKGKQLKKEIEALYSSQQVRLVECDLESLKSVQNFVEVFRTEYTQLHLLINNAGVWFSKRELTEDGFEKNFAINHLSHFLLTKSLLDIIKKTPKARIINVASEAHKFGQINFNDLQSEKSFSSFKAYGQSKLANILFTRKLSKILEGSGVTVNSLHPGVVNTSLFDKMNGLIKSIFKFFMITPEKGAATSIYLALSDEVANKTGLYFKKCKAISPHKNALNTTDAEKLWEISLELTDLN